MNKISKILLFSFAICIILSVAFLSKPTSAYAATEYPVTGTGSQNGFTYTYSYTLTIHSYSMIGYSDAVATITGYNGSDTDVYMPNAFVVPYKFPDSITEERVITAHRKYGMSIGNVSVQINKINPSAFKNNSVISTMRFPSNGIASIDIGEEAFAGCTNLKKVYLTPLINAGKNVFKGCTNLTSAVIEYPSFTQFSGEDWKIWNSDLFKNITSLTSLQVSLGIIGISNNTFEGCTNITSLTLPNTITFIGKTALLDTSWYKSQPDGMVYIGKLLYKYKGAMPADTKINIAEGTTLIAEGAFENCKGLSSVHIPNSIVTIEDDAFKGCTNLKYVTIPYEVKTCKANIFNGCTALDTVTISTASSNNSGVFSRIWDKLVFQSNTSIKTVIFQEGITSIGVSTFSGCTNLSSISIPSSVSVIGESAFSYCSSLDMVSIPSSVEGIEANAFSNCTRLSRITLTTNISNVGNNVFSGCPALKTVFIHGDQQNSSAWNNKLFRNNGTIEKVEFSNGVNRIGDEAFAQCYNLKEVIIPNTVKTIGFAVFYGCRNLESIYLPPSITSIAPVDLNITKMEVGYSTNIFYNMYSEGIKQWFTNSAAVEILGYSGGTCSIIARNVGTSTITCQTKYKTWQTGWIETPTGGYFGPVYVDQIDLHDHRITVFPGTFQDSGIKVIYGQSGSYANSYASTKGYQFVNKSGNDLLEIEKLIFDEKIYAANNPDVVAALGANREALLSHWLECGIQEGRLGSSVFHAPYYLRENPDLAVIYGNDFKAAYNQFISIGCMELRASSEEYNGLRYKQNYADLSAMNGEELLKHYINTGRKAGRIANKELNKETDYTAVFNVDFYKTNNPDVASAYGNDNAALLRHFIEYGMSEGRQGSAEFSISIYMEKYPDLVGAFGNDYKKYYLHYMSIGKNEGRIASIQKPIDPTYNPADYASVFNINFYKAKYPDVASAFGNNDALILRHFVECGMAEGRLGSEEFNISIYMSKYPDLVGAYGNDLARYYMHYIAVGKNEGRVASEQRPVDPPSYNPADYASVFDISFYITKYPDVASAYGNNDTLILKHFVDCGMAEARQGSDEFNISIYMEKYPDLVGAFGYDYKKYYLHYIATGKNEGRIASYQNPTGPTYNPADYASVFDINFYKATYLDVAAAFGNNDSLILRHFVECGMAEARQGSDEFNVVIYMENYPDLVAAYGNNLMSYYYHYMSIGKYEGRVAR